jgi:hypothetical protein
MSRCHQIGSDLGIPAPNGTLVASYVDVLINPSEGRLRNDFAPGKE